jgi:N-glycosylase/DNA lyase
VSGQAVLPLEWPIDLGLTVASHGWAQLAPWHWEPTAGRLARTDRLSGRLGSIAATQLAPDSLLVRWEGFASGDKPAILARVHRWVSADWAPGPAIAALGAEAGLIERGGGRILRCSSFYEDFVKTILTINTSWSSTVRMAAALVAEPGEGAFPAPEAVLAYGEARLRERAKLGFRAPTVIAATRQLLDDGAMDAAGEGDPSRLGHEYLLGIKGIGPYAAAHCRVLLQDFSRIPVDSSVTAYLRERHSCGPAAFAVARSAWGPYLALGYRLGRLREKLDKGNS